MDEGLVVVVEVAVNEKREQAGWRQLGFSIQFSHPEPWKRG